MKYPRFQPKKFVTKKHKWQNTARLSNPLNQSAFGSSDISYEFFADSVTLSDEIKDFGLFDSNEEELIKALKDDANENVLNWKKRAFEHYNIPKDVGHLSASLEPRTDPLRFRLPDFEEVTNRATTENTMAAYLERFRNMIRNMMKEQDSKTLSMWINTKTNDDIIKSNRNDGDTGNRDRSNRRIANKRKRKRDGL